MLRGQAARDTRFVLRAALVILIASVGKGYRGHLGRNERPVGAANTGLLAAVVLRAA